MLRGQFISVLTSPHQFSQNQKSQSPYSQQRCLYYHEASSAVNCNKLQDQAEYLTFPFKGMWHITNLLSCHLLYQYKNQLYKLYFQEVLTKNV